MRVIAGSAKGKRLQAPSGLDTRPITDRIKEALFNVLSWNIEQAFFLDLFAGSGSVGIEALSRGAEKVILVDKGNAAVKIIKENLDNCGFKNNVEVFCMDVFKSLQYFQRQGHKFDYIYVDPPFTNEKIFEEFMEAIDHVLILDRDGIMIIRTRRQKKMPEKLNTMQKYRVNNYGESTLHYYRLLEEVPEK